MPPNALSQVGAPSGVYLSLGNLEDGRAITGLVALGGGEDRIREAGRLARRYAQLQVVVTGAGSVVTCSGCSVGA
jgi:hypothetical protein